MEGIEVDQKRENQKKKFVEKKVDSLANYILKGEKGDKIRGRTWDLTRWPGCPTRSSRKPSICWQNPFLA